MKTRVFWKRIFAALFALLMLPVWKGGARADDGGLLDEERLNQWMDDYVVQHGLNGDYQKFSVGFCYTATGENWYYDADQWMYSASLYKVPVAMLMAEKEAAGELTQEGKVLGYTLQYLETSALTYSNNDSGHAMVDYLGGTYLGKCSDMTIRFTDLPEDYFDEDFYQNSYYTARYMTQVMKTLYDGGDEQFPHVIEYLLPAQPDGYLNLSLKGRFELAQKYGSYEEPNGNKNNHIAALVYTPTPVIITVMTRNVGDFQNRMAEVGAYLADYSLELDARAAELEAAKKAPPAAEEPAAAPEETGEAAAETAEEPVRAEDPAPAAASESARGEEPGLPGWLLPAAAAFVLLALALLAAVLRRRRAARRYREAVRARSRQTVRRGEEAAPAQRARDEGYTPRH